MMTLDDLFYLMGDEDTNVGLCCRVCDRGGLPIVFYTTINDVHAFQGTDVVVVTTIVGMFDAAGEHVKKHLEAQKPTRPYDNKRRFTKRRIG